jgi:hypothetical protein
VSTALERGAFLPFVLAVRTDQMLETLKQARLLNNYETELRRTIWVDLLILNDFGSRGPLGHVARPTVRTGSR